MCLSSLPSRKRKSEFYRRWWQPSSSAGQSTQSYFDNLKAAVLSGSGRDANLHPEFAALCGITAGARSLCRS